MIYIDYKLLRYKDLTSKKDADLNNLFEKNLRNKETKKDGDIAEEDLVIPENKQLLRYKDLTSKKDADLNNFFEKNLRNNETKKDGDIAEEDLVIHEDKQLLRYKDFTSKKDANLNNFFEINLRNKETKKDGDIEEEDIVIHEDKRTHIKNMKRMNGRKRMRKNFYLRSYKKLLSKISKIFRQASKGISI